MKRSLTDIVRELQEITWSIDDNYGEIDDDTELKLDDIEADLSDKVDALLKVSDDMDAKAAVLKDRAKVLTAQSTALSNRAGRIREYIKREFESLNIEKYPLSDFPKLSIRKNNPSVNVTSEDELIRSGGYIRTVMTKSIDKKELLSALKEGREIAGAELQQTTRLQWR